MSSTSSPYGLKPVYHPSGRVSMAQLNLLHAYSSGLLQYQPVKIGTNGYIQAAAANDRFIGVFMGVEWTDADGIPHVSNKWTANTATLGNEKPICYVTRDQGIVYQIQGIAAMTAADLGNQADFASATAGSTVTGLSACTLDSTLTSSGNAGLRIVGLAPVVGNAWTDTYPDIYAMISEHQDVADVAAYGG